MQAEAHVPAIPPTECFVSSEATGVSAPLEQTFILITHMFEPSQSPVESSEPLTPQQLASSVETCLYTS
ncbi:hypothetical protein V6N13_106426 [Hibiscus sabdariffa]